MEHGFESHTSSMAYLEAQGALLRSGGYWNCLTAAKELSARLFAEGRRPWIARLRKTRIVRGQTFHCRLTPRTEGVSHTWTTHYVCCCDGTAYDPAAGRPLRLESYSLEVFGEQVPMEVFVPAVELPAYLAGQ
jgi:hypothetical protein